MASIEAVLHAFFITEGNTALAVAWQQAGSQDERPPPQPFLTLSKKI
jgi:hypothetical protein